MTSMTSLSNPSIEQAQFGPVTVCFGEKHGKYPDGNQLIVTGRDTRAVFDTPKVANHIGPLFDDADLVIMGHVHEDHMAGLHRLPGVPVHVHEADLEAARSWEGLSRHYGYPQLVLDGFRAKIERDFHYAPRPDAIGYRDGATWDLGGLTVRAIHMPGHTAGHCVLMVEPHGIAFIGDIDLSSFGPYYGDATSNLADFRATLKAVATLPASVWITSHHKGAITSRSDFDVLLAAFEARIGQRSDRLLEMIGADTRSLDELVAQRLLYPTSLAEGFVDSVERHTIAQHLDELQAQGRVRRLDDGRYQAAA